MWPSFVRQCVKVPDVATRKVLITLTHTPLPPTHRPTPVRRFLVVQRSIEDNRHPYLCQTDCALEYLLSRESHRHPLPQTPTSAWFHPHNEHNRAPRKHTEDHVYHSVTSQRIPGFVQSSRPEWALGRWDHRDLAASCAAQSVPGPSTEYPKSVPQCRPVACPPMSLWLISFRYRTFWSSRGALQSGGTSRIHDLG